ncbi:pheromone-regulated protein prm10 [Sorochytrium milnesiophthora]
MPQQQQQQQQQTQQQQLALPPRLTTSRTFDADSRAQSRASISSIRSLHSNTNNINNAASLLPASNAATISGLRPEDVIKLRRSLWRTSSPGAMSSPSLAAVPASTSGNTVTGTPRHRYSSFGYSLSAPSSPALSATFLEVDDNDGQGDGSYSNQQHETDLGTHLSRLDYDHRPSLEADTPVNDGNHHHHQHRHRVDSISSNSSSAGSDEGDESSDGRVKRSDDSPAATAATGKRPMLAGLFTAFQQPATERHRKRPPPRNNRDRQRRSPRASMATLLEPFASILSPPVSPVFESPPSTPRMAATNPVLAADTFDVKRHFLVTLAEALVKFGSPTYRIEYLLKQSSKSLKVHMRCSMLPNLLLMTYESPALDTETIILPIQQGYDLDKLYRANMLCSDLAKKTITIETAIDRLELLIDSPSYWPNWIFLIANIFCSFTISLLLFSGSLVDALLSALLSVVVSVLGFGANYSESFSYVYEISASLIVSVLTILLRISINGPSSPDPLQPSNAPSGGVHGVCFTGVALSSLMLLLPGLTIATSFVDLNSKNLISGAVRLIHGFVRILSLAFGLVCGYKIMTAFDKSYTYQLFQPCDPQRSLVHNLTLWIDVPLLAVLAISASIQLRASPRQFHIMTVAIFAAFWCNWVFSTILKVGNETTAAVSAFVVGLIANVYSRWTHHPSLAPLLAGITVLVPGGLGVRSSLSLLTQDPANPSTNTSAADNGSGLVMQMIVVAFSISLGILVSRFIRPVEGQLKTSRIVQLRRKIAEREREEMEIMAAAESATNPALARKRTVFRRRRSRPHAAGATGQQSDTDTDTTTPTDTHVAEQDLEAGLPADGAPVRHRRVRHDAATAATENDTDLEIDLDDDVADSVPVAFGTLTVSDKGYMREREYILVKLRLWLRRWEWQRRAGKRGKREKAKVEKWLKRYEALRLAAQQERVRRGQHPGGKLDSAAAYGGGLWRRVKHSVKYWWRKSGRPYRPAAEEDDSVGEK